MLILPSEPPLVFYDFNEMDAQESRPGVIVLEEDITELD